MFHVNGIRKSYGDVQAVSAVSFEIEQGELIALIGPSGAGKTTLLNMLARLVEPDAGHLEICGKPSSAYSSNKKLARIVGMMRQQFDLVGPLPVIHNVLAGRFKDWGLFKSILSFAVPQEKEVAARALARVGLLEKMYDKTSNLSGGEQQRVALARLLIQQPQVILADEPVSSLDPARAEDILEHLLQLVHEEQLTLVASLHSITLARKYFTRLIGIKNGKVFFDLPSAEVTDQDVTHLYTIDHVESK